MSPKKFELPDEIKQEKAQYEAIMHTHGPLMIIAGPGSGKTKVIVWRTVKLLLQDGVDPESIWITTFTEKAAKQLRAEIASLLKEFDVPIQVSKMLIGTIHSTCLKLIENHPEYFPDLLFPPKILDEDKQLIFILSNYKRLKIDRACDTPGERPDISKIYDVIDHLNWLTDFEIDPEVYAKHVTELFNKGDSTVRERDIWMAKAYKEYLTLLRKSGYMDFGQILKRVADAIETKSFDKVIGKKIKCILVDEYQDVNPLQQYILAKVAQTNPEMNITVVGDDDQAIYQFRGAGVGTLRDFEKIFHPKKIELTTNFRSSKYLVEASSTLIATDAPLDRFPKKLRSDPNRKKEQLKVLKINAKLLTDSAKKTIELLENLIQMGKIRRWGDIVILLRSIKPAHLEPYITALQKHNIPYTVLGRTGLFSTPTGMGFLLYFDFLTNPKPLFTQELLKCSLFNLKKETIETVAFRENITKNEIKKLGIDQQDEQILLFLLDAHKKASNSEMTPLQAIYELLQASGYISKVIHTRDNETLMIISKITKIAREFEEMHSLSIKAFTDYIRGLWEAGRAELPETAITEPNHLKIMTVHQAKGLEFPVVVVGEAVEGRFPSPNLGDPFYKPRQIAKRPTKQEPHIEQEKRLFYVAMTRARDLLIITSARKVSSLHKRTPGETRWLKSLPSNTLGSINSLISNIQKSLGWDFEFKKERKVFSFSKLNYYRFCPFRYKLIREVRLAFPPKLYFVVGKNVHDALEHIHLQAIKGYSIKEEDVPKIVEAFWNDVTGSGEMNTKIKNAVIKYLKNYLQNCQDMWKNAYMVEKEFWVFFEEGILTGRIDLIRKNEKGELEIIDFKIGLVPGFDYKEQLKTYLLGVKLGLNLDITKAIIQVLKPTKSGLYTSPIVFNFTMKEIEDTKKTILKTINDINNEYFEPSPSHEKCQKCELTEYNLCPFAK